MIQVLQRWLEKTSGVVMFGILKKIESDKERKKRALAVAHFAQETKPGPNGERSPLTLGYIGLELLDQLIRGPWDCMFELVEDEVIGFVVFEPQGNSWKLICSRFAHTAHGARLEQRMMEFMSERARTFGMNILDLSGQIVTAAAIERFGRDISWSLFPAVSKERH